MRLCVTDAAKIRRVRVGWCFVDKMGGLLDALQTLFPCIRVTNADEMWMGDLLYKQFAFRHSTIFAFQLVKVTSGAELPTFYFYFPAVD